MLSDGLSTTALCELLENRPGFANRAWMDVDTGGWANRCLPLASPINPDGWC